MAPRRDSLYHCLKLLSRIISGENNTIQSFLGKEAFDNEVKIAIINYVITSQEILKIRKTLFCFSRGGIFISKIYGSTIGLKSSQIGQLEKIYRRHIPANKIIHHELARYLTEISQETRRQVGFLANRSGTIEYVIAGEPERIVIPPLKRFRTGLTRLRGLRYIHTHLRGEPLSRDDLVDLALLRLDLIAAFEVDRTGLPGKVYIAHLLPQNQREEIWAVFDPIVSNDLDVDFASLIESLEEEFRRCSSARKLGDSRERAILVSVNTGQKYQAMDSLKELKELAEASGLVVLDSILQTRSQIDPRYVLGKGKINDLIIRALQLDADLIVFDQELTPAQVRSVSESTDLKVIDRTQLILDIFAQRAQSRDGKIQVELAQLRYLLPRLRSKDDAFSRLTGGIGARGPGETKIEIDRRRVKEKITRLEKQIDLLSLGRNTRRSKRHRNDLPIISIIGYTNAGKSSLLNALTHSQVFVENKLFATLDPTSRRLRFPREREVIITDTVGFIRDLPRDLLNAFRATLEELQYADLFLNVVDISNPHFEDQMKAVENVIKELGLENIPMLKVFNKKDKLPPGQSTNLCHSYDAVAISALDSFTLPPLIEKIEEAMWGELSSIADVSPEGGKSGKLPFSD